MMNFQEMIIRINEKQLNTTLQYMIIPIQFIFMTSGLFTTLNNLDHDNVQPLKLEILGKINLPDISKLLQISHFWSQSVCLLINVGVLVMMILELSWTHKLGKIIRMMWDLYLILFWLIIHDSAYCLQIDINHNALSILNIVLSLVIVTFTSFYTIKLDQSQILIRMYYDRFNTILMGILAFICGLSYSSEIVNNSMVFIFMVVYDCIIGIRYYIQPTHEFENHNINKMSKVSSAIRIPIIFVIWTSNDIEDQTSQCIMRLIFILPIYINIINYLWYKTTLKFLRDYNQYFQLICISKYSIETVNQYIESYILFYFHIPYINQPISRILMMEIISNHKCLCPDSRCFCVNFKFYNTNMLPTSVEQETSELDQMSQKIKLDTSEHYVRDCYYKLVLRFIENYLKRIKNEDLADRLVDEINLQEVFQFQNRLFQSKIRINQFYRERPSHSPDAIRRQAIAKITTKALTIHVGQPPLSYIDVAVFIKYNKILENVTENTPKVIQEKLIVIDLLRQNYQSPAMYFLNEISEKYIKILTLFEQDLKQLYLINGESQIVKNIISLFKALIKTDYKREIQKPPKSPISIINSRNTAYIIAKYFVKFTIEEHSKSLTNIVPLEKSIIGLEVQNLIPGSISRCHHKFLANLVRTGQCHLLDQNLVDLFVNLGNYIKEIKVLVRIDPTNHNSLRIIGFIQDLEREDPFLIANDEGKIEGYSIQAQQKLGLDNYTNDNLNMNFLSPDLFEQESKQFDGFIILPKVHRLNNQRSHFKYFMENPKDCEVFYVSAQYVVCDFSIIKVQTLRLNACHHLKAADYKLIALDLMFRQTLLNQNIKSDTYKATMTSFHKIQTFKKDLIIQPEDLNISGNKFQVEEMELECSDRALSNKVLISKQPDLLQSLIHLETDRIADKFLNSFTNTDTQNNGIITTVNQNNYPLNVSLQEEPDDNSRFPVKDHVQETQDNTEMQNCIYISIKDLDLKNIREQINVIYHEIKKWDKHVQADRIIKAKTRKLKYDDQVSLVGEDKVSQSKLIQQMVINATTKDHILIKMVYFVSIVIMILNFAFLISFIIIILQDFNSVNQNNMNTSYPITIYNDLNYIILGLHINNLRPDLKLYSKNYIKLGFDEYKQRSLQINNYENTNFYFLTLMDSFTTSIDRYQFEVYENNTFSLRYLLCYFMIDKLEQIYQKNPNELFGWEESIVIKNYQDLAHDIIQAREFSENDVDIKINQMNRNATLQLVLAILTNALALCLLTFYLYLNLKWRKRLVSSYFLFPNLTPYVQTLYEALNDTRWIDDYPSKIKKQQNRDKDSSIKRRFVIKLAIVMVILAALSVGFYIPMVLYIQQQQNLMISYTTLFNQVEQTTLRFSQQFALFVIDLNNIKESYQFLNSSDTVLQDTVDSLENAQQNIFFNIPFDNDYKDFPLVQKFSHSIVSNSSLYGIQSGYSNFQIDAQQQLTINYGEVISKNDVKAVNTYVQSEQFTNLVQAYNDVIQFNIKSKIEIMQFLNDKTQSTITQFQLIAILFQIFIVLSQALLLSYVSIIIKNTHNVAKELIFCFNQALIATNKYIQQALARESIEDNK